MQPPDFSNRTLFGEQNDVLRFTWAGWLIIVLFPSLIGNITILVASLKYRAIKLHSVIVMFIEHLAMLDFAISLSCLVPKVISLIADRWILGRSICYFVVFATYYGHCANLFYVSALTTCKWLILNFPLRTKTWFRNRAHVYMFTFILMLALSFPITFLIVDKNDVSFDYRTYLCAYRYSSDTWQWLQIVLSVIFGFIPLTVIAVMSALLVVYLLKAKKSAKRTRGSFRWQGLVTVLLTASLYICSYLPFVSYVVTEALMERARTSVTSARFSLYYRLAKETMWFSVTYNIFIYPFTVNSLGGFIKGEVKQRLSTVSLTDDVFSSPIQGKSFFVFRKTTENHNLRRRKGKFDLFDITEEKDNLKEENIKEGKEEIFAGTMATESELMSMMD